ncbi:hypothetical protein ZWY2020_039010 [Hordeum vulgare]|nr:hypothetical protein ZWY2020_039010 [Hordeum vulgare]
MKEAGVVAEELDLRGGRPAGRRSTHSVAGAVAAPGREELARLRLPRGVGRGGAQEEDEDVVGVPAVPLRRLLTSAGLDTVVVRDDYEEEVGTDGALALLEGVGGGGGRGRVCGGG